jgi:hypothetical protein
MMRTGMPGAGMAAVEIMMCLGCRRGLEKCVQSVYFSHINFNEGKTREETEKTGDMDELKVNG